MKEVRDGPADPNVFPIRIAATDIGSNAIRFVAREFTSRSESSILGDIRVPVRLGHDVFLTGKLTEDAIDAAVAGLKSFAERVRDLKITWHRAVATSAVRESRNSVTLLERVRAEAGIDLEPITGAEEARLVHLAVRSRVKLGKQKWLVADLGGGSVETSIVDNDGIYRTESHEMGSVRLLEELSVAGEEPGRFRRRIEEYTAALRGSRILHTKVAGFIATGGNIEALAKLAGAAPNELGVSQFRLTELRAMVERLAIMSYDERVKQLDMREDRADVILPAAMVYERIAFLAGVDSIIVPNVGLKDGVVLDLLDQHALGHSGSRERAMLSGALALGRKFHFDEQHGRHVARLAVSLFDQLRDVHSLSKEDRNLLMAAALLHDVGIFVSLKRHHKHSLYIISESELPGLGQKEVDMIANVARYHRKNTPSSHHPAFTKLSDKDQERVVRLSALLRIADALDREHLQRVQSVIAKQRDGRVDLIVTSTGDLLLERWALQTKAALFEKVFDLRVQLKSATDK